MVDALVDEVADIDPIKEPQHNDAAYKNSVDKDKQPTDWAGVQDLLKTKYSQDREEYQKRKKASEDNVFLQPQPYSRNALPGFSSGLKMVKTWQS